MDQVKVICPLTKKDLDSSCPTCNFVVKYNDEIIGCAIKHIARNLLDIKLVNLETNKTFNDFKKDMKHYG
jgi:hypothetical protein